MMYYLATIWDMSLPGVGKKISSQIDALNKLGIPAKLYVFKGSEEVVDIPNLPTNFEIVNFKQASGTSIISKILTESRRYRMVRGMISSFGPDDIAYVRYINLRHIPRVKRCRVVVEHQTMESVQFGLGKSFRNRLSLMIEKLLGRYYRKGADGRVAVTEEILRYETERAGKSIPSIVIPNGIDVSSVGQRSSIPSDEPIFRIIGLANIAPWHGYDRIIKGISEYRGHRRIEFTVAGNANTDFTLRDLCRDLGVGDKVIFLGEVDHQMFKDLVAKSDLAVGTLAPHRTGLTEISSLKHREYCAIGIPFIYSGLDPDFPADFPYAIHVDATSSIDLEEVMGKVAALGMDEGQAANMRHFAEENLDWSVKMKRLAEWIDKEFPGRCRDGRST